MFYDPSDPKVKAELAWIAGLPASEDASRLLQLAKVSPEPGQPALLALFEWAVFEAAEQFMIDPTRAEAAIETVQMLEILEGPAAAVTYLLNLDDPENETLRGLSEAKTAEDAAWAAIGLTE